MFAPQHFTPQHFTPQHFATVASGVGVDDIKENFSVNMQCVRNIDLARTLEPTFVAGGNVTLTIDPDYENGTAIPVGEIATAEWWLYNPYTEKSEITKTLAAGGITKDAPSLIINLVPADTTDLCGLYYHEIKIIDMQGNVVRLRAADDSPSKIHINKKVVT